MNRKKLEATATYLGVVVLGSLVFIFVLGTADIIFKWDILPPLLEKIAILIISSLCMLLGACFLVSIMLNISIIADKVSKIADKDENNENFK